MADFATREILGVPIAALRMDEALDVVDGVIRNREPLHIGVVNAAKIANMKGDKALRDAVLESDIIFADGMAVVWASRVLGTPVPERVTGIDLMMGMLARGSKHGYRVYLLGAKQQIVEEVARRISEDYQGVKIAGYRNGYFDPQEEPGIVDAIAQSKADILLVAITSPKKERFLSQWGTRLGVTVYHGVGGSFDVYAGMVQRAPEAWRNLGLEWLYRLLQEPRRMWKRYLVTNSVFIWLVVKEWFKNRLRSPETHRDASQ